ncbi:MAG TPA: DUF4928 family protein, partial [Chitinophagales bacterium]|nr:DUF4928 family protein [Chitinophagales bacterium]
MMKKKQQKTVAEFFAGIGLMRAGLERAGWVTIFANDIDPVKYKLYQNHFKQEDAHFIIDDIHNIDGNSVPSIDLATASFPCTDLSLAGKRAGLAGKHSSAFWGFVNVLKEMGDRKPPLILLENVAGFLTSNNGQDFFDALFALNEEGYAVDAFLIDASHFIPQSRVRLFVVGKLTDEPNLKLKHFLPVTELRPEKLVNFISNHPEIHWNLNTRLPLLPKNKNNLSSIIETIPKSSPIWFSNDRVNYLLNQTFERHLTKILELKDKKTYTYLTAFRRVRNGKSMAEIRFDGIAGCLRTPKGGSARQILLEVGKGTINVRLLTPRECARLMGADDFKIVGTVNEALFGFGDAVCVPVVTWIAENYLNYEISHFSLKQQRQKEHAAAKEFIEWYNSLKVVKANNGPANGSIATALVVLNRLKDTYNLNFSAHVADGGTQIKGASGAAVAAILKSFGEKRPFAKEGGRTNRGGPSEVRSLLKMLNLLNLDNQNAESRNEQLNNMMAFLVERVKDFHNRQKIKLTFNPALSTWHIVHNLLYEAMVEGKAGYVAQHL